MNAVQARRDLVRIPNGLKLHQYANLYFDPWNPMLSRKRSQNEEICILKFDRVVLDFAGVILSDKNASSDYAAFYGAEVGLEYNTPMLFVYKLVKWTLATFAVGVVVYICYCVLSRIFKKCRVLFLKSDI